MNTPKTVVPTGDAGIARAETYRLLMKHERFVYSSGEELAPAKGGNYEHPIAVEPEYRLVFGNGLLTLASCPQNLAACEMGARVAGRNRQGEPYELVRPLDISIRRNRHSIEHPTRE
jgi:hypothetical protein